MKPLLITLKPLRVPMLLAFGLYAIASLATAQNYYPPSPVPPDLGFLPGGPSQGQIESVNPIAGNLNLTFPIATLPPGPGGFTTAVNLIYNSAFYKAIVDDNGSGGSQVRVEYAVHDPVISGAANAPEPDFGGAGWDYGFRYSVWEGGTPVSMQPGSSVYLRTPDGSDHRLLLVNALQSNGTSVTPVTSSFNKNYPGQPIYDVGVTGICYNYQDPNCDSTGHFQGTLIYASVDNTFVRVEVDTVNASYNSNIPWIVYRADGGLVYGNFGPASGNIGQFLAAETNQIQDKNGNTIALANFCAEGQPCTTTITDRYGRAIEIAYSSTNNFPTSWTDTISQPGVNGPTQTLVNWGNYAFTGPSYDCVYSGPGQFTTCPLTGGNSFNSQFYVVTSIQFPSATTTPSTATNGPSTVYAFTYDAPAGASNWGELHGLTKFILASGTDVTPCVSGGAGCTEQYQVQYNYYFDNSANQRVMNTLVNPLASKVLAYNETRDGAPPQPLTETTTYNFPVPTTFNPSSPPPVGGQSTITGPDGSSTTIYSQPLCTNNKAGSCSAVIYRIVNPDQTQTDTGWAPNTAPPATAAASAPTGGAVNPYGQYTMQWVGGWENGVVTAKDANGNTESTEEFDWSDARMSPAPTTMITDVSRAFVRRIIAGYNAPTSPEYWNYHDPTLPPGPEFRRAVQTTRVCNVLACDPTAAFATITYGYDSALTTANLTSQSWFDSVSGANIGKSWSYVLLDGSVNGNVVTESDPNGNVTQITYDGNNLYPTKVVQAGLRTTNPVYNFNSGLLSSSTDDNTISMTYTYDNIGRQTQVKQTGTGGLTRTTTTAFDDSALSVKTTQDQTGLTTTTYYDPLGRVRLTTDGAGHSVQHAYRAGTGGVSYELTSNPYNSATPIDGWKLMTRNLGNVTTTAQTLQGSDPPGPWGSNTSSTGQTFTTMNDPNTASCVGPTTDVQDQAGNTTKYCADGLGRLASVTDAAGNLTQHAYDLLDNLIYVIQNGQARSFEYSSLGRLTKACNPETGTAACSFPPLPATGLESYTYDATGNVLTKTDARSVLTTYSGYDGLNRPQSKSYSDGTPTVTYTYDSDWKGALSSVSSSVGTSLYSTAYTHDGFGRVSTSTQTTASWAPPSGGLPCPSSSGCFVYTYSLADQLTQVQYPSGRTLISTPDSAGRITSVQNKATGTYYANGITYNPAGGILTIPMGNGLTETDTWNDRQQLLSTYVTSGSPGYLLGLNFYPCANQQSTCSSGNTGNLQGQMIGNPTWTATQTYTYDPLGRLQTASESYWPLPGQSQASWSQSYGYDTAGGTGTANNRYVSANSGFGLSAFTPTTNTNFDARNRLNVDSATYDPSGNGNQISIGGSGGYVYTYDAENRMTGAYQGTATTPVSSTGYVYDGDGQRVQKIVCAAGTNPCTASTPNAVFTTYVYDAFGNLAAEYGIGVQTNPWSCETCYITVDQVGSTRMVTDNYAYLIAMYDYLPSGEELLAGVGSRTTAMGYTSSPDLFNPKFTGQMRDPETGLDHMGFRYYSPQEGRFITVDPENAGADQANPQTWNGYAYVGNNPLNVTDPMGLGFGDFFYSLIHGFLNTASFGIWDAITSAVNGTSPGPGPVPGLGGFNLGTLTGCGGPLGTCGMLGAGPWSELTGLADVQDPGRFIMGLEDNSYLGCVSGSGNFFSVQSGIQSASGGRLGNGWLAGALFGNPVSDIIDIFHSASTGDAGGGLEHLTSIAGGKAAEKVLDTATELRDVTVRKTSVAVTKVRAPGAALTVVSVETASRTLPLGTAAKLAKPVAKVFEGLNPWNYAVSAISAMVCGIGR